MAVRVDGTRAGGSRWRIAFVGGVLLACGAIAVVGAFTAASCSSPTSPTSAKNGNDPATPFVGQWIYASGNTDLNCTGPVLEVRDPAGRTLTVESAASGRIIVTLDTCKIPLTIEGNVASAGGGVLCEEASGGFTTTILSLRLELTAPDRLSLSSEAKTTGAFAAAPSVVYDCRLTSAAQLERRLADAQ